MGSGCSERSRRNFPDRGVRKKISVTLRILVLALCAVGLYVSLRMQGKIQRASRGELSEPSVVQTPRAMLVGRTPNSTIGIAYYALLGAASFFLSAPVVHTVALVASILAALMSVYLAYSLLFVTKMPCAYCWTGHVVNWLLLATLLVL
jgi:uncharacterized membrane protein